MVQDKNTPKTGGEHVPRSPEPAAGNSERERVLQDTVQRAQRLRLWKALEDQASPGAEAPALSVQRDDDIDTLTSAEYGRQTWTTGQTVRDMLQNHLDAEAERYMTDIVDAVIDMSKIRTKKFDEETAARFDAFCYALYRYAKGARDCSPESLREWHGILNKASEGFPLLVAHGSSGIDLRAVDEKLRGVVPETPPHLLYNVRDTSGKIADTWVTREALTKPPLNERAGQGFRFEILGMEAHDNGSGFDAKLTEFYKSYKDGAKHLRGKFGEGLKMNYTHLSRNGVDVEMRSSLTFVDAGGQNVRRVWRRTPFVREGKVFMRSVHADVPAGIEAPSGSSTTLSIERADPEFQRTFRENVDPRLKGGIAANCIDYGSEPFRYPVPSMPAGFMKPPTLATIGVSLGRSPKEQFVQGLRVEGSDVYERLFSYDILDGTVFKGRDRNAVGDEAMSQIVQFWTHVDDPKMLTAFVRRVFAVKDQISYVETPAMSAMLGESSVIPVAPHVQRALFATIRDVLGLIDGKNYVLLSDNEQADAGNRPLLDAIKRRGYDVVTVRGSADYDFSNFNAAHKGRCALYTLKDVTGILRSAVAGEELASAAPSLERINDDIVVPAIAGARELLARVPGTASPNFEIRFIGSLDPERELPFELLFDEASTTHRILIRPDILLERIRKGGSPQYWVRRMQVDLLAAASSRSKFAKPIESLRGAQVQAQCALEAGIASDSADRRSMPSSFEHSPNRNGQRHIYEALYGTREKNEATLRDWHTYDRATRFGATLADLDAAHMALPSVSEPYKQKITEQLFHRCIVEDGIVGFHQFTDKNEAVFCQCRLEDMEVAGQIDGKPCYRVGDNLVYPFTPPLAEGDVVTVDGKTKYLYSNKQLLQFESQFSLSQSFDRVVFHSHSTLHPGCVVIPTYGAFTNIDHLRAAWGKIDIQRSERSESEMRVLAGTVPTPLAKDYGAKEWDKPARVFQDVVQNHIDAAPDGRASLIYQVLRGQKRVWVTEQHVQKDDRIVGFCVRDNGSGYPPDNLGTMGFSSKKSPLFAGKYGEGMKLIAAAAARKGLDLRYSSVSSHKGQPVRWFAKVGTQAESIAKPGQASREEQRVVFSITSEKRKEGESYASQTVLLVPDERLDDRELTAWFDVIDPRKKDTQGHGGLARHVRSLRPPEASKDVIDLGYMRILLNEPGAVYENGLLIGRDPKSLALGYDVPSVTSTRERNAWDNGKLKAYIAHALMECTNSRLIDAVVQELATRYADDIGKSKNIYVKEFDLNFGTLFQYKQFVSSHPYWRIACQKYFPGLLVHSSEELQEKEAGHLRSISVYLEKQFWNPEAAERELLELRRLQHAMANIGHIPQNRLLHVSSSNYNGFEKVMPSAREYLDLSAKIDVPASEKTLSRLRDVAAGSAREIAAAFAEMERTDSVRLGCMLTGSEPPPDAAKAAMAIAFTRQALAFWTDPTQLAATPKSVFVSPAAAGYNGLSEAKSVGINEMLLQPGKENQLAGVMRHEILHSVTNLNDYTPEFVMFLLELAHRTSKK